MNCGNFLQKILNQFSLSPGDMRSLYESAKDIQTTFSDKHVDCSVANILNRILKIREGDVNSVKPLFSLVESLERRQRRSGVDKRAVDLYHFAFEEVGHFWKELGAALGFLKRELDGMEEFHANHRQGVKYIAWAMLEEYRAAKGFRLSSIEHLRRELAKVKGRHTVKIPENERKASILLPSCIIDDRRFYGREEELLQIAQYLWNGKTRQSRVEPIEVQRIQIIAGVGGVGKTTLGFKYALQFAKSYSDGIFYFNAESYPAFLVWLRENAARAADLTGSTDGVTMTSHADALRVFFGYLARRPRSLLFLDNADDFEFLKSCLPGHSVACHVVITTRRTQTHDIFHQRNVDRLTLNVLQKEKAIAALYRLSGKLPDSQTTSDYNERKYAEKVAVEPPVEGLPLALSHAGSFIEQHRITFRQYWTKLEAEAKRLEAAALNLDSFLRYFHLSHLKAGLDRCGIHSVRNFVKLNPTTVGLNAFDQKSVLRAQTAYEERQRVFLTWEMDLDDVRDDETPDGYLFLKCCSVMSSQGIPLDVVADAAFPETVASGKDYRVSRALKALNERSLVQQMSEPDNEASVLFVVHHLIQASVLQRLGENVDDLRRVLKSTGAALFKRLPSPDDIHVYFSSPSLLGLVPHVYSVAEKMLEAGLLDESHRGLIDYSCALALGYFHYDYAGRLCSLRVEVFEAMSTTFSAEESRLRRRDYYFNLARYNYISGNWHEGDANVSKALGGRRLDEFSESEMRFYRQVLWLLVESQVKQRMLEDAEETLRRLLSAYPSEIETPEAAENAFIVFLRLASVYRKSGRFEEEQSILNEALLLGECGLFDPGINLAACYQDLAKCQMECDLLDEALKNFFQALKAYQRIIPDAHEDMGFLRLQMAECFRENGMVSKACEFSYEGLSIVRSVCPPEHPLVPRGLLSHGHCLLEAKRYAESVKTLKECLGCFDVGAQERASLAATATCLTMLGEALRGEKSIAECTADKNDEAIRCYEKSITIYRQLHPDGHPDMIHVCTALSSACMQTGKINEALDFAKLAWNSSEFLPEGDENRIAILAVYVKCLGLRGKFAEAEQLLALGQAECNHLPRGHQIHDLLLRAESTLRDSIAPVERETAALQANT